MDKVNKRVSVLVNLCFIMMGVLYIGVALIGFVKWYAGMAVALIAIINTILGEYVLRKDPGSLMYRYIVTVCTVLAFTSMLFLTPYKVVFAVGMVEAFLLVAFYDIKILVMCSVLMNIVNITHVIRSLVTGKMVDGSKLDGVTLFLQLVFILLASTITIGISLITNKISAEQIGEIEEAGEKNKVLLDEMKYFLFMRQIELKHQIHWN